jgi:hypothetical protein
MSVEVQSAVGRFKRIAKATGGGAQAEQDNRDESYTARHTSRGVTPQSGFNLNVVQTHCLSDVSSFEWRDRLRSCPSSLLHSRHGRRMSCKEMLITSRFSLQKRSKIGEMRRKLRTCGVTKPP